MHLRPALPALLFAAACQGGAAPGYAGLWVFTFGGLAFTEGEATCTENFDDADCDDDEVDDTGDDDDVDVEIEGDGSPAQAIVEAMAGEHGEIFFFVSGRILEGSEVEPGHLQATWEGFGNQEQTTTWEDAYTHTVRQSFTSTVELHLTVDGDEATGHIRQTIASSLKVRETDELDGEAPVSVGRINTYSGSALESDPETNGAYNYGDEDDCAGDACELELAQSVSAERPVTASPLQDNGYPNAGSYPGFTNPEGGDDEFIGVLRGNFAF